MTIIQNDRIAEIISAVRSRNTAQREILLSRLCVGDPKLRRRVEDELEKLAEDDTTIDSRLLQTCAPTLTPEGLDAPDRQAATPSPPVMQIGSYRVIDVLGEGSMGLVYRARQQTPDRVVALKVLRAGEGSRVAQRRFEYEVQMLARLRHPAIAQVYDAGTATTPYGSCPYFAMELVDGISLRDHVATRKLSVHDRLALVAEICDGVQHAHQKGVIHRDLKPANILVDELDRPKILDFGIAVATDHDVRSATLTESIGVLAGTVPYMSPEQIRGDFNEIDTRTDVYALGVILFELLAGRLPFDLKGKSLPEAVRLVSESHAPRVSSVKHRVHGDIEIIVAKALEKDKARRYQSAADLAEDMRRYLADQPIAARPPSPLYQVRKYAARNRILVGSACIVVLGLLGAGVASAISLRRVMRAEAKSKAINTFLIHDLLAQAAPTQLGHDVTVREALDRAAHELDRNAFAKDPEIEAALRQAVGQTYRRLDALAKAKTQLLAALTINRRVLGENHPQTLASMNELAALWLDLGELDKADQLFRRTLDLRGRVLGDEHTDTLRTQRQLAELLCIQGKLPQAGALYEQTLDSQQRTLGAGDRETLLTMNGLALVYSEQGEYDAAEELYRRTLAAQQAALSPGHADLLLTSTNLAGVLVARRSFDEAESVYRDVLQAQRRGFGPSHSNTLMTQSNLGALLRRMDRLDEAAELCRDTLERRRVTLGDRHPDTLGSRINLAAILRGTGHAREAEQVYRAALDILRSDSSTRHETLVTTLYGLSDLLSSEGRNDEARHLTNEALALRRSVLPERHARIAESLIRLAMVEMDLGDVGSAEPRLREALTIRSEAFGHTDWRTANVESLLGECLTRSDRFVEAEPMLLSAYETMKRDTAAHPTRIKQALRRIVAHYERRGDKKSALQWRVQSRSDQ